MSKVIKKNSPYVRSAIVGWWRMGATDEQIAKTIYGVHQDYVNFVIRRYQKSLRA